MTPACSPARLLGGRGRGLWAVAPACFDIELLAREVHRRGYSPFGILSASEFDARVRELAAADKYTLFTIEGLSI